MRLASDHRQRARGREEMLTSSLPLTSHRSPHSGSFRRAIRRLTHREGTDGGAIGGHAEAAFRPHDSYGGRATSDSC
jgi:hypothetical protein